MEKMWLAGSSHGLFCSRDGVAWEQAGAYAYRIPSIVRAGGRVCAGSGNGLWEVRKAPAPWVQLHDETLTEVLDLAFVPGDPGVVAASAYGVALGVREDAGVVRWRWKSDRLAVNERYANAIAVDPEHPGRWLVGTEAGVLVAEADGARWTHTGLAGCPVRALCRAMDAWWAGTDGRGIWRSPDGLSWRRGGRGLDDGTVFALCETRGRLLAGTLSGVAVGDGQGRWQAVGPRALVAAVAAHPEEPDRWAAGAVPGGLWTTEDGGRSWRHAPQVPPSVEAVLAPEGGSVC